MLIGLQLDCLLCPRCLWAVYGPKMLRFVGRQWSAWRSRMNEMISWDHFLTMGPYVNLTHIKWYNFYHISPHGKFWIIEVCPQMYPSLHIYHSQFVIWRVVAKVVSFYVVLTLLVRFAHTRGYSWDWNKQDWKDLLKFFDWDITKPTLVPIRQSFFIHKSINSLTIIVQIIGVPI